MLIKAKTLEGCELRARDGVIGRVKDVYFDDEHWHVRYLVVDTGSWMTGRTVLISAAVLQAWEWDRRTVSIDLTREQVRNSPGIDTARPVSRQQEERLHQFYAWPYYWSGPIPTSGYMAPGNPAAAGWSAAVMRDGFATGEPGYSASSASPGADADAQRAQSEPERNEEDSHLRSLRAVRGYDIQAADGTIGQVDDVVIDESTWAVRYLLVDTSNWWTGRKVLVGLSHIREISWYDRTVVVDLPRDEIKASPDFDEARPLTSDYVDRLDAHYRRRGA
jgi:uncharacterized protein YrrD